MLRQFGPLILLSLALGLTGCAPMQERSSLDRPLSQLPFSTPKERASTLYRVEAAWDLRPDEVSKEGERHERRFINRYGALARKFTGTEAARPAANLWRKMTREHEQRYP